MFVLDWVICKQRWTNIRDQYKKNLKCLKSTTGQAAKKIKLYKFYEQLQFLKGFDEDRDKIENFAKRSEPSDVILSTSNDSDINQQSNSQAHDDVVANDSDINQQSNSQAHNDVVASSSAVSQAASSATNEQNKPPSHLPTQKPQTDSRPNKKKKSAPVPESASSTLMKYVLMSRSKNTEKEEQHSIDAFLQGLAPTLKSFSPYLQHVAKGKIFQVIHDLEFQHLTENLTSSPSPTTPIILSSPSPLSVSTPVISSPLPSLEQPETLEKTQLPEQSIHFYLSQYDCATD